MIKEKQKVPVIMYHSIGYPNKDWIWSQLTCPIDVFESQIRSLSNKGFNSINLQELYDYMRYEKPLPQKPIVLTFDDGYLDNWVYVYPLLKKYGLKGTIYLSPEFVDPTTRYRPNSEDVWLGKATRDEIIDKGFLSWQEMRRMEEDGVMEIQSHALTHTWYFNNDEIIDFRHPKDRYIWIDWNGKPEKKYDYLRENYPKKYGMPVYSHGESLITHRYFPDKELEEALINFVKRNGEEKLFERSDWRHNLFVFVTKYKKRHKLNGRFESDDEYGNRVRNELLYSKKSIEKELKKEVKFLCWPGGAYNEMTLRLASEIGYISSTFSSKNRFGKNIFGEDSARIKRIPVPNIKNKDKTKIFYFGGIFFIWYVYSFMEIQPYYVLMKGFKKVKKYDKE